MGRTRENRLDALLHLLLSELGEGRCGAEAAVAVHLSRSHAARAFRHRFGESPAAFRRRLTLERAAWTLRRTDESVTAVALEAGFDSLEAFTRAFRRAYGVSPSLYRRLDLRTHHLPAPGGIHFQPLGVALHTEAHMDILDHLLAFDEAFTRQAIAAARTLPPAALDQPLGEVQPLGFESPDRTLRDLLDKLVFNKEVWVAAVRGRATPERDRTLQGLQARLEQAFPAFRAIAREVQAENKWRQTFVDALCEPAEVFPYGGVLAHVLTVDAHRRHILSGWLWRLGVRLDPDPMLFGGLIPEPPRPPLPAEEVRP
ncbi:helix-turn-helix transcriptional regulator [Deinococcus apachensis]|uniref:helix-turn-helix transcriptional regulator n=1 Tax=Deinococcus apachensis TaxID=309886 RepID=UPI00035F851C|nr:helix-turn-helix transcriptional regulator [Deinococcus apachensis]